MMLVVRFDELFYIYTCMNEKIQAILLQITLELKKLKWVAGSDWEITLKSEGHVPLVKQVAVEGSMGDEEWRDNIETHLDLKLTSEDELTYFPDYTIYANIFIEGGSNQDIAYKMDADVAFTERDVRNKDKISLAAKKIDRLAESHIEQEFSDYVDMNANAITFHRQQGGWKEPEDNQI
jgi:hypothetical protein